MRKRAPIGLRRAVAEWLNEQGSSTRDAGKSNLAVRLYKLASSVDPRWSVPWYNLGLIAKYAGNWEDSLRCNQRALALKPDDEGACWNLGIAATALRDWPEAMRAWKLYGIEVEEQEGEVRMPPVTGCVRLNPNESGETVWGDRIDPARLVILNVPLPESGHRFHDIVLNDGAPSGTRVRDGVEISILDELAVWEESNYSTFETSISMPSETAEKELIDFCNERKLGIEDWSSVWWTCAECSRGKLHAHEVRELYGVQRRFGFGAQSLDVLTETLAAWAARVKGAEYTHPELVLDADA